MDLFGKSPRPKLNGEIQREFIATVGKIIFDWCGGETPLDDCVSDSGDILLYYNGDDGYSLAKDYERKGYQPNSELVELLDGVWSIREDLLRSAIRRWVIEDDIKPELSIGDNVVVSYASKKCDGVIGGINLDTAEYLVYIPSEGMPVGGTGKAVIKYENAEMAKEIMAQ